MKALYLFFVTLVGVANGYSYRPVQYHIQTDDGPTRFFRYQTYNGQYRKEKRLRDGSVVGSYGWVDPNNLLRLYDYVADKKGYRIVRSKALTISNPSEELPALATTTSPPKVFRPLVIRPQRVPTTTRLPQVQTTSSQEDSLPEFDSLLREENGGTFTINYDLGQQFHIERVLSDGSRVGKHGYVDPFGILRTSYYRTLTNGKLERKERNRWVGSRDVGGAF